MADPQLDPRDSQPYRRPEWYEEYLEERERIPNSAKRLMSCLRGADIDPMRTVAIDDFLRDVAELLDAHATHDA